MLQNLKIHQKLNSKLKLQKPEEELIICTKPILKEVTKEVDYEKISSKNYSELIKEFITTIEQNFDKKDLSIFYRNINTVEISPKIKNLKNLILHGNSLGFYNARNNSIQIEIALSIYHELFHMASTIKTDNVVLSGFKQSIIEKQVQTFGLGLNEGYTQDLAKRYFPHAEEACSGYPLETEIAENLETVVGHKKMSSFYLNADLYGLINYLNRYNSLDNIIKFIHNIDLLTITSEKLSNKKLKKVLSLQKEIDLFLIKTYSKKLEEEYQSKKLNEEEVNSKFLEYIMNLGGTIICEGKEYTYIEDLIDVYLENLPQINTQNQKVYKKI